MDETTGGGIFSKIVAAIFILALFDLVFINWWILKKSDSTAGQAVGEVSAPAMSVESPPPPTEQSVSENTANLPGKDATPVASPSPVSNSSKPTSETVVIQAPNKEIFIPMGTSQTTSTTFTDLGGLEVSIDTSKYGAMESVTFEASIWVEGGNGRAWAQIRNVTDNNPFIESQISNPTSTPTLKVSGKIPLPGGSKTYRVQARSELEQYPAHVENARLKIVLK